MKGTVFAVSAGMGGSVVSVVEGSVAVNQPGIEVVLSPGEQSASNPALASSVEEAVAWSPEAADYLELLASFVKIERQLAELNPAELRTSSALLPYLPEGAFVFGAVPNLGGKLGQALMLAEQQSTENATFGAWWNSETGRQLRQMVDRLQSVSSLLGDEVAFSVGVQAPGQEAPIVMARVQPGKREALASALDGLFADTGEPALPYSLADDLMVVSNSASNLAWALGHLGQGAGSPFAAAIRERYQRGVGWLVGIDAAPVIVMAKDDDAPPVELAAMVGLKYLFLEQRAPAGAEENEITLVFPGERQGMASWLADSGSGGAAEYLPADALVAGYVSTREPWQLFQEMSAFMTKENETFAADLAAANGKLGEGFLDNLTAAMGTESAFALNGFSVDGPQWVMAVLANDSSVIDNSLRKLADAVNAELAAEEQTQRIVIGQEIASGRTWTTMKAGGPSIRRDVDLRSGLPGGGLRPRVGGTGHRDPERGLAAGLVAGVPGPASLVCRDAPVGVRVAEREGGARDLLGAGPEPGVDEAAGRARRGARGRRRAGGTDPRGQPYSSNGIDHGRDAARESRGAG